MAEKDDGLGLGLSLSLGLGMNPSSSSKESLMQKKISSQTVLNQRRSWNDIFQLPDRSCEARTLLRGVDVNLAPPPLAVVDCEDENGVSSPNSTVSSISGKRSERESIGGEHEAERASCSRGSDDDDDGDGVGRDGDGDTSRKKLRLSKEQSITLEETFKEHNTLNPKQKQELAKKLNLRPRQVEVWFQNRRARTKLKQTEVDCEYLRRCCETLTEENRRLQKEVQELRALKLSPQLYMHMNPPTTLTMCPSCERVAVSSTSSSSSTATAAAGAVPVMASSNSAPLSSSIQRPVPFLPWAANSNLNRPADRP